MARWTQRGEDVPQIISAARDPEVEALDTVLRALRKLSQRARERVITHVVGMLDEEAETDARYHSDDPA